MLVFGWTIEHTFSKILTELKMKSALNLCTMKHTYEIQSMILKLQSTMEMVLLRFVLFVGTNNVVGEQSVLIK